MDEALTHPTKMTLPQEMLRQEFVKITHTGVPDAAWHFEIIVHKSTRLGPALGKMPVAGGDLVSLALFNRPEPPCDTEIFGLQLAYDIDPADWLDLWMEAQEYTDIVSRKRFAFIGGAIGDVLARWQVDGTRWVGRFFVTKAGARMILHWSRVAEADYPNLAEPIFFSILSFRMLDDRAGPLAENVRWANGPAPVPWKVALPVSWQVIGEPGSAQVGALQANLVLAASEGAAAPLWGKLSLAIIGLDAAANVRKVEEKTLAAVREGAVAMEPGAFVVEALEAPYTGAWYLRTTGTLNGMAVAIHGRILRHPQAWVAAVVVGPARQVSPALWMRVKRMLDIATMTLVMG